MMAKKKERKEGKVNYSGRQSKAQGEGLELGHEKKVYTFVCAPCRFVQIL